MGALGVNYMQYQAGQAMREAAQNTSGGVAGVGVGLGAGVGLGQALGQAVAAGMTPQAPSAPAPAAPTAPATSAAPAGAGAQSKAQIRAALTNLDVRLANGEISEAVYNRLYENLSKALETAPD
jgi:membrane protease subunit (stomatin/prohibitin family)